MHSGIPGKATAKLRDSLVGVSCGCTTARLLPSPLHTGLVPSLSTSEGDLSLTRPQGGDQLSCIKLDASICKQGARPYVEALTLRMQLP